MNEFEYLILHIYNDLIFQWFKLFDIDKNKDSSSLILSKDSNGFGYWVPCSNSDQSCLLWKSNGKWVLRKEISISTGKSWLDPNWMIWNSTENLWDAWNEGFLISSSSWIRNLLLCINYRKTMPRSKLTWLRYTHFHMQNLKDWTLPWRIKHLKR